MYNLLDPEEFQNAHIAIVGGGNAALESAQYLARKQYKNTITLLVRDSKDDGFARALEDNQKLVYDLEQQGLLNISFHSSISKINETSILIKKLDDEIELKNDYIFVFAGAEMPHKFLMSLGIEIDKAHGEIRGKKLAS